MPRSVRKTLIKDLGLRVMGSEVTGKPGDSYRVFFSPVQEVKLKATIGMISAETITPYPPGIPRLIPGELITRGIVDDLRRGLKAGMFVTGAADSTLEKIRVMKVGEPF